MLSAVEKTKIINFATFNSSFANALYLVQAQNLSFGKESSLSTLDCVDPQTACLMYPKSDCMIHAF